ncbi:RuBisCO large subunit C-terminal-like domain-containing protein [Rhodopila sp.]|uniref:RuBisCO large subunit C-terminal-like domain-containing protein n=1 Tax=Rhodopila sp. TaxID=2480087 RepID=UPI002B50FB71|nr:RuBisCO large subunit C-terminal-like domain-containing protein [Rhodopila sp.]HVZ09785.1 RuBisCO large subunit C-terminal-like domain-containing protein [Rhodopila sp.]
MRFAVTYLVESDAASIEARAKGIAVEQSVEMPLEAVTDERVLADIVGEVEAIQDQGHGRFAVRIALASATVGTDAGQFMNMLFGNTSLQEDVILHDVAVPETLREAFGGPRHGIPELRRKLHLHERAFAGSALKPQGLTPGDLALLAERFARGGLDFVKDDHGLADQHYSRFADRIRAVTAGIAQGVRATGHPTRYIPSLTGNLDQLRAQAALAREEGIDCVMVAPMVSGVSSVQALVAEFPDLAFFAHPSLGGLRISPDLLIGKLFPLIGADAVIFPSFGGRFGYSPETCRRLALHARCGLTGQEVAGHVGSGYTGPGHAGSGPTGSGPRPALPVPAGGMTLARTGEILDFYGPDTMLLIGGNLLLAREHIATEAEAFVRAVADHRYT